MRGANEGDDGRHDAKQDLSASHAPLEILRSVIEDAVKEWLIDLRDIVENSSILRIPVFELFSGRCSASKADLCSPDKEKTEKDVWFWVLEGHDNGCQIGFNDRLTLKWLQKLLGEVTDFLKPSDQSGWRLSVGLFSFEWAEFCEGLNTLRRVNWTAQCPSLHIVRPKDHGDVVALGPDWPTEYREHAAKMSRYLQTTLSLINNSNGQPIDPQGVK
ncbi:hypothetical protein BGZ61DRAFT_488334 [Ilyonectria robusta]|uniref:uncharacterized protein n=1 Tax=Ilyonectria robusta TaxID=1079257 RepID=UPI001E8D7787|nr:uncharacterized protein BGZ61DRAFT_488334 [Ilyonectria robusta]KAH8645869.1 hypothetical protein BGZ61DRAFT_488334 [Ilyonectria robusta]